MITERVIREIYRKFSKSSVNPNDERLVHYIDMLAPTHHISMHGDEVVFDDQEDYSPFKKFLLRSLNGIIEFDRQVAFVFRNHIVFLDKYSDEMRVHIRRFMEKKNILQRLFAH